jgi:hypothetical protein
MITIGGKLAMTSVAQKAGVNDEPCACVVQIVLEHRKQFTHNAANVAGYMVQLLVTNSPIGCLHARTAGLLDF